MAKYYLVTIFGEGPVPPLNLPGAKKAATLAFDELPTKEKRDTLWIGKSVAALESCLKEI